MRADSALQRRRPPVAAKFDGAPVREGDRPRPKERHVRKRLSIHGLTDRAVAEEAPDRLALHGEARGAAQAGTVLLQRSPPSLAPRHAVARRRAEPPVEVGLQILDVLEADAEANRRAAGGEARRGAGVRAVERNGEALVAAPRIAEAEQLEPIEERRDARPPTRASAQSQKRPEEPVKSRFQSAWPG